MITLLKYKLCNIALWGVHHLQRWLFVWTIWNKIRRWQPSVMRNIWICHPDIAVYVRLAMRFRQNTYMMSLDLASVEVREHARRRRRFADTLLLLEGMARVRGYHRVTVENILNPDLVAVLARRGYLQDEGPTVPVCSMYKTITRAKIGADGHSGGNDQVDRSLDLRRRMRGGR